MEASTPTLEQCGLLCMALSEKLSFKNFRGHELRCNGLRADGLREELYDQRTREQLESTRLLDIFARTSEGST